MSMLKIDHELVQRFLGEFRNLPEGEADRLSFERLMRTTSLPPTRGKVGARSAIDLAQLVFGMIEEFNKDSSVQFEMTRPEYPVLVRGSERSIEIGFQLFFEYLLSWADSNTMVRTSLADPYHTFQFTALYKAKRGEPSEYAKALQVALRRFVEKHGGAFSDVPIIQGGRVTMIVLPRVRKKADEGLS